MMRHFENLMRSGSCLYPVNDGHPAKSMILPNLQIGPEQHAMVPNLDGENHGSIVRL